MKARFVFLLLFSVLWVSCMPDRKYQRFKKKAERLRYETSSIGSRSSAIVMEQMNSKKGNKSAGKVYKIFYLADSTELFLYKFREDFMDYVSLDFEGKEIDLGDYERQMGFTIGKDHEGAAYQLKERLRSFIDNMNQIDSTFHFNHIVKDGKEVIKYQKTEKNEKDFVLLNFKDTPNAVILALISQLEYEVARIELEALQSVTDSKPTESK